MGLGLGLIMAPAMSTATLGVDRRDAGVASAMVNTGQQIGGSIGTALLSTLAASAAGRYAPRTRRRADLAAQAAVHGYTTAFVWSAGDLRDRRPGLVAAAAERRAGARARGARRARRSRTEASARSTGGAADAASAAVRLAAGGPGPWRGRRDRRSTPGSRVSG